MKAKLLRLVLYSYALAAVLASVPLMLLIGPAVDVENGTSLRLLGAALFSLGIGAVAVARDPLRNRHLLVVEIVFTALATVMLVLRAIVHHSHVGLDDRVILVLPPVLVCLVLLLVTFPYGERQGPRKD